MCGIFGFSRLHVDGIPDGRHLASIAEATLPRGRHAHGFAWLDVNGRLRSYRAQGPVTDSLQFLRRVAGEAIALVGHCRYATDGSPADNINNHPHPCDGGYLVHNGVIPRWQEHAERRGMLLSSACDTEVLCHEVTMADGARPVDRVSEALRAIPRGPLACAVLWHDRLVLARDGNPMNIWRSEGDVSYFGSVSDPLRAGNRPVVELVNLTAMEVRLPFGPGSVSRAEQVAIDLPDIAAFDGYDEALGIRRSTPTKARRKAPKLAFPRDAADAEAPKRRLARKR